MIVVDEQVLGRGIEYDMARWYRGAVQSITDLQPMPCCSTLLVTHRPDN